MSCFVHDHALFEKLLLFLNREHNGCFGDCFRKWHTSFNTSDIDHLNLLARALYRLNWEAYESRYPGALETPITDEECPAWNPATEPFANRTAAYKAVVSLRYQCAEGDCVRASLYHALTLLELRIAHSLISPTDEYHNAPWSYDDQLAA